MPERAETALRWLRSRQPRSPQGSRPKKATINQEQEEQNENNQKLKTLPVLTKKSFLYLMAAGLPWRSHSSLAIMRMGFQKHSYRRPAPGESRIMTIIS